MKERQGPPAPEDIACGCDGSLKKLPFISYVLLPDGRLQERLEWDARGNRGGGRASASEQLLPLPAFPSPRCSPHRARRVPLAKGRHTVHTGVISACQREEREQGRRGRLCGTASCGHGELHRTASRGSLGHPDLGGSRARSPWLRQCVPSSAFTLSKRGSRQTDPTKGQVLCLRPCWLKERLCSASPQPHATGPG